MSLEFINKREAQRQASLKSKLVRKLAGVQEADLRQNELDRVVEWCCDNGYYEILEYYHQRFNEIDAERPGDAAD